MIRLPQLAWTLAFLVVVSAPEALQFYNSDDEDVDMALLTSKVSSKKVVQFDLKFELEAFTAKKKAKLNEVDLLSKDRTVSIKVNKKLDLMMHLNFAMNIHNRLIN